MIMTFEKPSAARERVSPRIELSGHRITVINAEHASHDQETWHIADAR